MKSTIMPLLILGMFATAATAQPIEPPDLRYDIPGETRPTAPARPAEPADDVADRPSLDAPDPRPAFRAFALDLLAMDGLTLHHEPVFGRQIADVQQVFTAHFETERRHRQRTERLQQRRGEVVAELLRIVGLEPGEEDVRHYETIFADALAMTPRLVDAPGELHAYLLRQETIKAHLREGGELPGFEYDADADEVDFYFGVILGGPEDEPIGALPLPLDPQQPAAEQIDSFLQAMRAHQDAIFGSVLHEVVQVMMMERLDPADPYHRWFSEGFASAIALRMASKYVGSDAATAFAVNSSDYRDLQNEINLYYWMDAGYEIATPLDSEALLAAARYAYAVDEADLIIERRGLNVVKQILDYIAQAPYRQDVRKLDAALAQAAGVRIEERMRRYQRFATREEGIAAYARRSNEALEGEDYQAMLPNMLRIMELRESYDVSSYANIAYVLHQMGYEELGDAIFDKQLALLEATEPNGRQHEVQLRHLQYALQTDAPWKAYDTAERLLERDADYVPALAVRMHRFVEEQDYDQAGLTAQKIIDTDRIPGSPYPQAARQLLEQLEPVEP